MGVPNEMQGLAAYDDAGRSVAISADGKVALVGAMYRYEVEGIARAYRWNTPIALRWNRLGNEGDMAGRPGMN
jgi:hypothetical protein